MDERLLELKREGLTLDEIALELGLTYDQTRWRWRKLRSSGGTAGTKEPQRLPSDLPVVPVSVTLPPPKEKTPPRAGPYTSLHYGDVHYPFEDKAALGVLYSIIEDIQPQLIVNHGDLVDAYPISQYQKDPHHRISLQKEIELAALHLATVTHLAPDAEKWLLEGNHEDRLRRHIWKMAEKSQSRELVTLTTVREALEWKNLLGLDDLGWEWVEGKRVLFNRLVIKHGDIVRKWSSYTARGEHEKYGKGGISGHTHRMGTYYHRDLNGANGWWETGCLCDLDPHYVESPNWQQGFVVVTWNEARTLYGVEHVHIHEGRAFFRGKEYS